MADFFSTSCNSALRAAPARPPDTGDTARRLAGRRGGLGPGRERSPGVPAALATVGPFLSVVGLKCTTTCTRYSCTTLVELKLFTVRGVSDSI